jgi:F-type H+-transporting ATPase subunit delta
MKEGLIPQRYAKALYKYSLDKGTTAIVYAEMKTVVAAFEANPTLHKTLANPFVNRADKENLLLSAAGGLIEDGYKRFVKLIIEKRREALAYQMALAYLKIYREDNNISKVEIVTAAKLDEAHMNRLKQMLENAFANRTFEISEKIDPDIIGGFLLNVDSVRMDASLKNEIEQLRQNLLTGK